jgi:beta-phosphoglucomutase family hydrolase
MKKHKVQAVIFDLDGVITKTALVHSHAWKKMFDDYLKYREEKYGEPFREFTREDYLAYVDGKPRYDGVKSFLESRGIDIPFGTPEDSTDMETVCGLGNRKNEAFNEVLRNEGVDVYKFIVRFLEELEKEGIKIGVASSSKNCKNVLEVAGLSHFFKTRVDGVVSAEMGLKGKPEPDIFLTAAKNLGSDPAWSVVVEDAVSGVAAGRKGNFGLVLGVARENNEQGLWQNGADIVIENFENFSLKDIDEWFEVGMEEASNRLVYYDYDETKERSREALLTVGNGFFGTRGAMEETKANKVNYPGTYIAGLYNRLVTRVAGRDVENEDFVNAPNWLPVTFKIEDGQWFSPDTWTIKEIKRTLDFKTGLLTRQMTVEDDRGRLTRVESCRFAGMHDMHVAALRYKITPLNYSGTITVKSELDGTVKNEGVERYKTLNSKHLEPVAEGVEGNLSWLLVKTNQSGTEIAEAARLRVEKGSGKVNDFRTEKQKGRVTTYATLDTGEGETVKVEKLVSIATSLETEGDLKAFVSEKVMNVGDFDDTFQMSAAAWGAIWDEADVRVEGDRASQRLLRMHIYHLMVSASPHNVKLDASVTARGLHGEAYRGHIFWDELFILPFYDIHFPDISKALLMYRYRRLDKAREYAAQFGYKGAMFPWQSGSDGREETQVLHLNPVSGEWGDDHSSLQRHVSLAIAFNVYQYFHLTEDIDFINDYGAEMIFEIARFWASKAEYDEQTGRYSIAGVMGPDEFHEMYPGAEKGGLKDNAYTNVMTAWLFEKTEEIAGKMDPSVKASLFEKIGLDEQEISRWQEIKRKLRLVISEEGIIAQFDGYFDLKELDWDYYREKYGNIYRMDRILKAEGKSADEYKVAKQADTLMIFYNLKKEEVDRLLKEMGYNMPEDYLEKNLRYYLARTSHGSTLSRVVHAQLANMIGDEKLSWKLYYEALESDYNDIQGGTTGEGIHAGVMAGTIMIALTNFAGIDIRGEVLKIDPKLPERWKSLHSKLRFKRVEWDITVSDKNVRIMVDKKTEGIIYDEKLEFLPE